jgi:lipopolysaccharide transport system ATP-binding protein
VDPDILLIDEILGVGDAAFRAKATARLRERIRSNKTVVVVSHNPGVIRELCDRAVWIESGVSRAQGDAQSVVAEYAEFLKAWARERHAGLRPKQVVPYDFDGRSKEKPEDGS